MLPDNPSLRDLQEEFAANGLRGWLWAWLHDRLRVYTKARLAKRYRPGIYSPSGEWDEEGISDLVNDFLVERGLTRRVIQHAMLRAANAQSVIAYLEECLHRYAISSRRRTVAANVFLRLREVLASDDGITRVTQRGREFFGPAGHIGSVELLDTADLPGARRHLPNDVRWVQYQTGERLSPGISNEDLTRIARAVISGTGRFASASQIMSLIRGRYGLTDEAEFVSVFDGGDSIPFGGFDPLEDAVASDLARAGVSMLDSRQKAVLREWLSTSPSPTVRDIAGSLGVSKSLVSRIQREIAATFGRLHVQSLDEGRQVLKAAAPLL